MVVGGLQESHTSVLEECGIPAIEDLRTGQWVDIEKSNSEIDREEGIVFREGDVCFLIRPVQYQERKYGDRRSYQAIFADQINSGEVKLKVDQTSLANLGELPLVPVVTREIFETAKQLRADIRDVAEWAGQGLLAKMAGANERLGPPRFGL